MGFRDNGYNFFPPLQNSLNIEFNSDNLNKSMKLSDSKDYVPAFWEMLKYLDLKVKKFETSPNILKIPHGSIFLNIDFSGDYIKIYSDFLDITNANKVPLLRRVNELSFSALNLSNIKLENDKLFFEFQSKIELFEPYKIFDVLAEICYFADKYDEEFCTQFGAKPIIEPEIIQLTDSKKEEIYKNLKEIIEKNFEVIKDLEDRRRNNYAWDIISTTYKMIDFSCSPKGTLALRISEKVSELYDRDETLETIIFRGKEFLKEILEMPKEDFFASIYEAKEFIPNKKVATSDLIIEYLKPGYEDAYRDLQSGDFESAYIIFMHILYNSMYYHIMPESLEKNIIKIIKSNSKILVNQKSVSDLALSIHKLLTGTQKEKKGFFAYIWGILAGLFLGNLFGE